MLVEDNHHRWRDVLMTRLLEPRDGGAILGETFRIYGRNWLRLCAITAAVAVIFYAWYFAMMYAVYGGDPYDFEGVVSLPVVWLLLLVTYAGGIVGWPLMAGALVHAVSEQHFAAPVGIGRAYSFAWRRLGNLIAAAFLYVGATFLLSITLIGIPFAIYLAVRWLFCFHAILLEGLGPVDALSRSWSLVGGCWWRTFGILLLVWVAAAIIGAVFMLAGLWAPYGVSALLSVLGTIVLTPIYVTAVSLLYYDTRLKKETYSLNALAYELGIEPGGAAA